MRQLSYHGGMTSSRHAPLTAIDLGSALLVVLIWGTNFVAMKFGLRELTPFQMGAGRFMFAMLPLVFFMRPPSLPWRLVVLYGLCQGVGQFGLLFLSLKVGMSASLASVILQTQVFFTAFLGYVTLHERIGPALRLGLVLAAFGLICFGANYAQGGGAAAANLGGFALCLCAAFMWAASNIVVRRAQRVSPDFNVVSFMAWSGAVPILPFVALSLMFDDPSTRMAWTHISFTGIASLAYLGWMATILGYAMWTRLLKRHPVNRVAPFSLGVPVVGIASGMLVLGDSINGWQWTGILLIVAALVSVMFGPRLLEKRA